MSKYTPGPWELSKEPPNCGLTVTLYATPRGSKTLGTIHTGSDEYMANARLIAAAPELLEALESSLQFVLAWLPDYTPGTDQWKRITKQIKVTEAAIKKARG